MRPKKEKKENIFEKANGTWVWRWTYNDPVTGTRKIVERTARDKAGLEARIEATKAEFYTTHKVASQAERERTFSDLVEACKQLRYHKAVIKSGRKVSGVRSIRVVTSQLKHLTDYFGKRVLREITFGQLQSYKLKRLETVTISTVNREMSLLRSMFNHAVEDEWIIKSPFKKSLIDKDGEQERTRILTRSEEADLLSALTGKHYVEYQRKRFGVKESLRAEVDRDNPEMRVLIVLAVESAMRLGEMLRLRWKDVDIDANEITVEGTHTKTQKTRLVPLTNRAKEALEALRPSPLKPDALIFQPQGVLVVGELFSVKRAFTTARKTAEISDLHFHDLRRTAITRMVELGIPLEIVGKIAGHEKLETTHKHYLATDRQSIATATAKLNAAANQLPILQTTAPAMVH